MKTNLFKFFIAVTISLSLNACTNQQKNDTLREALSQYFLIGTAMNTPQILEMDSLGNNIILTHFNAVTAENCMKSEVIQPAEGQFDFSLSDKFVDFAQKNNLAAIGHTLIWHSQTPEWFFKDAHGKDVSREVLIERIRKHIFTVMERYKGRIHGWDVVNEAIEEDGSWRKSKFFEILGREYVSLAFHFAQQADPDAELYYNDFNMASPGRRQGVIEMVREIQNKGLRIDGIGMQGHIHLGYPDINEFEKSMIAFSELGVKVMITEMDINMLPFPNFAEGADVGYRAQYDPVFNPYPEGLPDSAYQQLHNRYLDFFKLFLKHRSFVTRVTLWGVTDGQSWLNNWPIHGRTNYPLLFDRNHKAKPVVQAIIDEANKMKKQ